MVMLNFSNIMLSIIETSLLPDYFTPHFSTLIICSTVQCYHFKVFNECKSCSFSSLSCYFKLKLATIWFRIVCYCVNLFLVSLFLNIIDLGGTNRFGNINTYLWYTDLDRKSLARLSFGNTRICKWAHLIFLCIFEWDCLCKFGFSLCFLKFLLRFFIFLVVQSYQNEC